MPDIFAQLTFDCSRSCGPLLLSVPLPNVDRYDEPETLSYQITLSWSP